MKTHLTTLALLAALHLSAAAAPLNLYVAPNGKDTWSGRNVRVSANDGPFATVNAALLAARAARAQNQAPDGVAIWVREGTYELNAPILITPQDSGPTGKQPLTIAAYRSEKPLLSGGRSITGWKQVPGKRDLWETVVPAVRDGQWYFRQLFVNGKRAQRARTPNEGFYRIQGPSPVSKPIQFNFKPGEIKKAWAADGDVEVIALLAWADIRMQIRDVDEQKNLVTLSGNPQPSNKENNAQYYIENAPDGLDQPGEWYLERKTGRLTYWAKPGENLAKAEVIAPFLQELVILKGDMANKKPVQHVIFRGLSFGYTDYDLPSTGYADTQAAFSCRGDVQAEAAVDCRIEDCNFSHLAGYGIELGRGCKRFHIVGNELGDLGAGGIRLGETGIRPDPFEGNEGHVITDNHIHHVGEIFSAAVGVMVLQSGNNRIAHNHIHHLYYTAISLGWNWSYNASPCKGNIVEFNHLHDIGQYRLSDMGAVYTLGPQPGTVIRNNVVHDVYSFTYGGWGLYTDEGSTGIVLENNVVYRTKSAGFHQHYGKENIIRNNIFAFGKENQVMRTRPEPHISFFFTNNIVYWDSGKLLGSNWGDDKFVIDSNIYFDARPEAKAESLKFANADRDTWKKRGHDLRSAHVDPMFANPQKLDFSLNAKSPAIKLGFKPIDLKKVGIRKKSQRKDQ